MASTDDVVAAIGCLSTNLPSFIAKEIASLTDQLTIGIQSIADPIAAAADIDLEQLTAGVAELTQGSIVDNLESAGIGLVAEQASRELSEMMDVMAAGYSTTTKRAHAVANMADKMATTGMLFITAFADVPYVVAQRISRILYALCNRKITNLENLKRHLTQLSNAVLVLVENSTTFKDSTLADLDDLSAALATTETELQRSQRVVGNKIVFDSRAFDRAILALEQADAIITPAREATNILGVTEVLTFESIDQLQFERSNWKLATLAVPQLCAIASVEMSAVESQTSVINYHLEALEGVTANYQNAMKSSKAKLLRERAVFEILKRVQDLKSRVDSARSRGIIWESSAEMILWAARTKSMLSMMAQVKKTSLTEGATDPNSALALETALHKALSEIAAINEGDAVAGVEDIGPLKLKVNAIIAGAKKIVDRLSRGSVSKSELRTFHALVAQTALLQISKIDTSVSVTARVRNAVEPMLSIEIGSANKFQKLLDMLGQFGFDRALDTLGLGQFGSFLDLGIEKMSYLSSVLDCLGNTINTLDDVQTKKQLSLIRNKLVSRQTNQQLAAADSVDGGRIRFVTQLRSDISEFQKSAETAKGIYEQLKKVGEQLGVNLQEATAAATGFLGDLQHLEVGEGGRLKKDALEYSKNPSAQSLGSIGVEPVGV
jgi:hypothetical protein